ncbi:hypothetical protein [Cephaloticoccus primus]|uniref:hypothetical protein n=1 Tax=Cephaloticoccus primus TaxID=1548207 RepID=UPI0012E72A14|nr:hypothetical protein [Cephaloticoccus primus]
MLPAAHANAAAAASAPVLTDSSASSSSLGRQISDSRVGWSDAQWDEWAVTTSEEDKFAELKAAIDVARAEYDAGLGIEVPHDQLGAFIHGLSEEAGKRAQAKREALALAHAS